MYSLNNHGFRQMSLCYRHYGSALTHSLIRHFFKKKKFRVKFQKEFLANVSSDYSQNFRTNPDNITCICLFITRFVNEFRKPPQRQVKHHQADCPQHTRTLCATVKVPMLEQNYGNGQINNSFSRQQQAFFHFIFI